MHSSLLLQSAPVYPKAHLQVNVFNPSIHVPPFLHGLESHSLTSLENIVCDKILKIILIRTEENRNELNFTLKSKMKLTDTAVIPTIAFNTCTTEAA